MYSDYTGARRAPCCVRDCRPIYIPLAGDSNLQPEFFSADFLPKMFLPRKRVLCLTRLGGTWGLRSLNEVLMPALEKLYLGTKAGEILITSVISVK